MDNQDAIEADPTAAWVFLYWRTALLASTAGPVFSLECVLKYSTASQLQHIKLYIEMATFSAPLTTTMAENKENDLLNIFHLQTFHLH